MVASQTKMLQRTGRVGANMPADKLTALFTAERTRILKWIGEQKNMELLECDYREIVEDSLFNAQRIATFLELELDINLMAQGVDAKLYRNKI